MTSNLDSTAVAEYLADNPQFFRDHNVLLGQVKLTSPLTGKAVSLQERQMEVMREKYKILELRLADFIRIAQQNDCNNHKFQTWTQSLLLARNDVDLPHVLTDGLQSVFGVPYATLRLWRVAEEFGHTWFSQGVSDDARIFANSLAVPYCGANHDFEAVRWLDAPEAVQSVAIVPLRRPAAGAEGGAVGLLILGSPDPARFTDDMATDFLLNISATASAALDCLLD